MPTPLPGSLSVSVVVYRLNASELARNLQTLRVASDRLANAKVTLTLIDNSETSELAAPLRTIATEARWREVEIISRHGNVVTVRVITSRFARRHVRHISC